MAEFPPYSRRTLYQRVVAIVYIAQQAAVVCSVMDSNPIHPAKLCTAYTVPRYNMKCSGEIVILRGIFHVVSGFPLHFMLYCGNLDCFSNSVQYCQYNIQISRIETLWQ